ncbi:Lrp/AsnC family transcriptional regulator [Halorarum salinum]|uniref:Lrp/AsnC ligand binding domain-containing protein n=1 Tax=Halorarum salinum TaxID=2743089 RepID=A0A7D5LDV0_9EURY|nr:Lrp/AsnC ligand binding domain-containing protein [Halobaculum salinum]QLG64007.1 Lrp/AsnC ligand binding domain-containing protein [Halobaculum salinum]
MVKANTGDADRVKGEIEAIDGVEEAHIVAGDVDFVARIVVDGPAQVKAVSAEGIQGIDGVEDTRTYIAMD